MMVDLKVVIMQCLLFFMTKIYLHLSLQCYHSIYFSAVGLFLQEMSHSVITYLMVDT